ncbi:MAG: hypothetical protein ABIW82_16920 [Dokdonella sp.]
MALTKGDREALKNMFCGRCAYCGAELADRWHADHVEAVRRRSKYVRDRGFVATGEMDRPENDCLTNMMPACVPCNIDKHSFTLEQWRKKLSETCGVLQRNNPNYRHALRFGLVQETGTKIRFYFETTAGDGSPARCASDRQNGFAAGGAVMMPPFATNASKGDQQHG